MSVTMGTILPPSRLLPATIAATSLALSVKVVALILLFPGIGISHAEIPTAPPTGKAVGAPGTAQVATAGPIRTGPSVEPAQPAMAARGAPPQANDASNATQDIRLRRSAIEKREIQVTQREALLTAADQRLATRVAELASLQSSLQALQKGQKERDEANWGGLVKLYEGMRPHEAASIFNSLEKTVLLEILDRMKPAKAAPVIASMEPEKARQVTAELATRRTRITTATN